MNDAQGIRFQGQGKGAQPVEMRTAGLGRLRALRKDGPEQVELMVAEDAQGGSALRHGADDAQDVPVVRTSVDEVSREDRPPAVRVAKPVFLIVAQLAQEVMQLLGVPVEVADDVVPGHVRRRGSLRNAEAEVRTEKAPASVSGSVAWGVRELG